MVHLFSPIMFLKKLRVLFFFNFRKIKNKTKKHKLFDLFYLCCSCLINTSLAIKSVCKFKVYCISYKSMCTLVITFFRRIKQTFTNQNIVRRGLPVHSQERTFSAG